MNVERPPATCGTRTARGRDGGWLLLMVALAAAIGLSACAAPPRSSATSDPTQHNQPVSVASGSEGGRAATSEARHDSLASDVAFEEDQLPTAPEDVAASPLNHPPVDETDLSDVGTEPPDSAKTAAARETPPPPRPPTVTTPVAPSVQTPVPPSPVRMLLGFRVQLHAGENEAEAQKVAREAEARLHVKVYVSPEPPYFKVRAGDFLGRAEALALRDRAREYGYPEAWVVTTPVRADAAAAGKAP